MHACACPVHAQYNGNEVLERVVKDLFPEGAEKPSPFDAPTFGGGSVEEYVELLLYDQAFNLKFYPQLLQKEQEWIAGKVPNVDMMQYLMVSQTST